MLAVSAFGSDAEGLESDELGMEGACVGPLEELVIAIERDFELSIPDEEAERILRRAIQVAPEEGEAYYSLGLLLAEENRLSEAEQTLRKAAELIPDRARVRYNYALALQHLDRREEAETQLLKAYEIDPNDVNIMQALAVFYMQDRNPRAALPYAQKMVQRLPGQPGPLQFLKAVQQQIARGGM